MSYDTRTFVVEIATVFFAVTVATVAIVEAISVEFITMGQLPSQW